MPNGTLRSLRQSFQGKHGESFGYYRSANCNLGPSHQDSSPWTALSNGGSCHKEVSASILTT